MKKIVSWILLVLMITLLLSSCAKGDIAPEGSDMTSLPIVTEKPQETPAVPEETAVPEEPDEETPGE